MIKVPEISDREISPKVFGDSVDHFKGEVSVIGRTFLWLSLLQVIIESHSSISFTSSFHRPLLSSSVWTVP